MKHSPHLPSLLFAVLLGCSLPPELPAQAPAPDGREGGGGDAQAEEGLRGHWEFVGPSGKFIVRMDQIVSVSLEEYLIDGALRVRECSVSTTGPVVARFYHIEPVVADAEIPAGQATLEQLREIANRVGKKTGVGEIDNTVTKHYPDTTHAKTSEFRLKNRGTIDAIYDHLHQVWAEGDERRRNRLVVQEG